MDELIKCRNKRVISSYRFKGSSGKKQNGAVMEEFIIITSFILSPLFYGISLIGKYTENQQKLEAAARYTCWERTVLHQEMPGTLKSLDEINTVKSAEQIGFETQNRVFSQKDAGVYFAQNDTKTKEKIEPISKWYFF